MKAIIKMVLILLVLATCTASAATDEEILGFANGVLAAEFTHGGTASATIGGDDNNTLLLSVKLDDYVKTDVGSIGYNLYRLSGSADTIVAKYPDRFNSIWLEVYANDGSGPIGEATITVI